MSIIDRYFSNLLEILKCSNNLSYAQKNDFWINRFKDLEITLRNLDLYYLPELMPLIHPNFLYDENGNFLGDLVSYNNNSFSAGINETDICQIDLIQANCTCLFNSCRNIRGKCQADHLWPHSLGGPSIFDNRILLCRYHNVAKSNSIVDAFWKSYPIWLNDYLFKIYNLKS